MKFYRRRTTAESPVSNLSIPHEITYNFKGSFNKARVMRILQLAMLATLVSGAGYHLEAQRADSAAFVVRLGNDTTSIERYVRTADQLIVEAVQRSPNTSIHRIVYDLDGQQNVKRAIYAVSRPGSEQPTVRRVITFTGDSAVISVEQGGQVRTQRVVAKSAVPVAGPFYAPYELALMRATRGSSLKSSVPLLAGTNIVNIPVERIGRDSASINNQFGEPMRVHIDAQGRLLHLNTPAYTSVERIRWVDLDRVTNDFAQRDAVGKGLGMLSPRQTYRANIGPANIWIDYSRPAMRGRPIWGALVPYGRVWRTGANDAAHLATDRTIDLGGLTLAPGTYTLFLLPSADDWTLLVNRKTGMSGLDYDAAQDVGRVKLNKQTTTAPAEWFTIDVEESGANGTLNFAWDRTRASVPITVR
jgi:hypothetical protein